MSAKPQLPPDGEAMSEIEYSADQAIALCDGDGRAAVIALLIANTYLETELELALAATSSGFSRQWHHKRHTDVYDRIRAISAENAAALPAGGG